MLAYDNIEKIGTFTLMRPIFVVFLVVLILLFFSITTPFLKEKIMNGYFVVTVSVLSVYVAALTLFYSSVLADEMKAEGDPVIFYLFLAIAFLGLLNPFLYFSGWVNEKMSAGEKRVHRN